MAVAVYTNNATATLSSSITAASTSLTVTSGQGALFPSTTSGNYFYVTLIDTVGTVEIVKVTAKTTDTFTIVRAQDGTTASAFASGSKVELRIVAAGMNEKLAKTGDTATNLTINGGTISGITDLAVADGGTGASTPAEARTNLGIGTLATQDANNVNITGGSITTSVYLTGNDTDGWGRVTTSGSVLYVQAGSLNSGSAVAQDIVFTNMYGGTERLRIGGTGSITSANLADAVGYKGLPQNNQGSATYTLALTDQGKHVLFEGAASTMTVPTNASVAFPVGASIVIINDTNNNRTISPASGVTLVWAGNNGTTGTRTLGTGSMATLVKIGTDKWYIIGAGLT